jgi:hypothetical protein
MAPTALAAARVALRRIASFMSLLCDRRARVPPHGDPPYSRSGEYAGSGALPVPRTRRDTGGRRLQNL